LHFFWLRQPKKIDKLSIYQFGIFSQIEKLCDLMNILSKIKIEEHYETFQ